MQDNTLDLHALK